MNNFKNRLRKLESAADSSGDFCRCGTPFETTFVITTKKEDGRTREIGNVCPNCEKKIEPPKANQAIEFIIEK